MERRESRGLVQDKLTSRSNIEFVFPLLFFHFLFSPSIIFID